MRFATTTSIPFAAVTAGPADVAWSSAVSLDCQQAVVRIPGMGLWMPATDYTLECWNFARDGGQDIAFDMEDDENGTNRVLAHLPWGDGKIYFDSGNLNTTGRLQQYAPASFVNQWHHLAFQVDSQAPAMRVFIDGQPFASTAASDVFKPRNVDFIIGLQHLGCLGEFRVWNRVRSQAEIQEGMARVFTSARPGLLACWRLDDTLEDGGRIVDYSGYGRHGSLRRR